MADAVTLEIKGLDALMVKFGAGATPMIRTLTRAVAEEVKAEIARYPGPVKHPVKWASDRQRRWWFSSRREAGLGPYVRNSDPWSQRLGPSWATAQRGDAGAVVGTRVTYAPWVQSAKQQQPMHAATGWVTDEQAVQKVNDSGMAERLLEDIMRKW